MKILYLVRHAKSSWKDLSLADHERPLNKRGKRDAPRMGKRLAKRGVRPDYILSSPAVRALTTARVIAKKLGCREADVVVNEAVYGAGTSTLHGIIRGIDNRFERAMLVGHNPSFTVLVNQLAGVSIENVPTCGVAVLVFETDNWADVGNGTAKLLEFDYPKKK